MINRLRAGWDHLSAVEDLPKRLVLLGKWGIRRVEDRLVDAWYRRKGLDTSSPAIAPIGASFESVGYVATDWRMLRTLFPPGSIGPDDVLLEYGSGKGRAVVWVASRFPARRVIGVEVDSLLSEQAEENLRRWTGTVQCDDVVFVCEDARRFKVPDDVTIVYLFNPFMGEIFDEVIANLRASLDRHPRSMRIVYTYPIMHEALIAAGFDLVSWYRHPLDAWAVYQAR